MSEHLKIEDLGLGWLVGVTTLRLAGVEIELNTENSSFITYSQAPLVNHVNFPIEGIRKRCFIDPSCQEEVFTKLAAAGIPHVKMDHPSTEILEMFWNIEMEDFDAEMDYYEEYGELPK